jgi:anti-anti-sigma factor
MSLEIAVIDADPHKLKLELSGQLDTATAPELEAAVQRALRPGVSNLVFELSGLSFIASAGLRVFAKARKQIRAQGGNFYCINPSPQVRKVFEIVKATPLDEIFTSVQELDDYLKAMQERLGPVG